MPGDPVPSDDLISSITERFAVDVMREARAVDRILAVRTRHLARDFRSR